MDSASCCGDTSALTLVMSQPNSSAYRTLAMASLEQRWCFGGGQAQRGGGGPRAQAGGVASPGVHGALHGQGGEDLLSHCLLWGMQPLSDSGLATTSGKSPEDGGWGAWGGEPGRWCDLSQARSQPGAGQTPSSPLLPGLLVGWGLPV